MNVIQEIDRINAKEMSAGIYGGITNGSWHDKYKDSAWVYVGGLSYELTEGDILCFMSQWGEIEDINVIREKATGKSQGFAFLKYDDQRSTILAVDNFNGIKLLGRTLRVDHVDQYRLPKEVREQNEKLLDENPEAELEIGPGHAYKDKDLANQFTVTSGINMWGKPHADKRDDKEKGTRKRSYEDGAEDFGRREKKSHVDKHNKYDRHEKRDGKKEEKKHKKDSKKGKKEKKEKKDKQDKRDMREEKMDKSEFEHRIVDPVSGANDLVVKRADASKDKTFGYHATTAPYTADRGAALSWRGNRDPATAVVTGAKLPSHSNACSSTSANTGNVGGLSTGTSAPKRGPELQGFGGLNRLR